MKKYLTQKNEDVEKLKIVTVSQMKQIEKLSDENGVSYFQLMENAGTALAENILRITEKIPGMTVFLCGNGNNAGDCFVAARIMKKNGRESVLALVCGEPKTDISLEMFSTAKEHGIRVLREKSEITEVLKTASCIADGVFGTGFHGELSEEMQELFSECENAVRIAVDIPSGGNASSGKVSVGCFKADHTVTFGYLKTGMTQYPLRDQCGEIHVADIGIPEGTEAEGIRAEMLSDFSVRDNLRKRESSSHKGTYGTLVCVTGSASMPGASLLSARAALRSGCGLVKMCTVPENTAALAASFPEAVYIRMKADPEGFYTSENVQRILEASEKASAVLVGCGLGVTEDTRKLVCEIIKNADCPVILDADGINCICGCIDIIREAKAGIILTPHPAEMSRLTGIPTGQIQSDRFGVCTDFISEYKNAVLVLKGAGTLIGNDGMISVSPAGNPGMSCGGSGDVLSGIIASFAAQGIGLYQAAKLGVTFHGLAGDLAARKHSMHYMLPTDIITELQTVFKENE